MGAPLHFDRGHVRASRDAIVRLRVLGVVGAAAAVAAIVRLVTCTSSTSSVADTGGEEDGSDSSAPISTQPKPARMTRLQAAAALGDWLARGGPLRRCPACGAPASTKFCEECGANVESARRPADAPPLLHLSPDFELSGSDGTSPLWRSGPWRRAISWSASR